jgi:4'-phosphopantetheinyl transferase
MPRSLPARLATPCLNELMMDFKFIGDEIHVWLARLDGPETCLPVWQASLSPDERERLDRYRFGRDRKRFIARRGILRQLLGQYFDIPATKIDFTYSEKGKPSIKGQSLKFNLSHSGEFGLYAFANDRELGIDIETVRAMDDLVLIAERYFSAAENLAFVKLPENKKVAAFYHIWTQKEAFVKVLGSGLSFPLAGFDVVVDPDQSGNILSINSDTKAGKEWHIHSYFPVEGFRAAVCYYGNGTTLRLLEFPHE